MTKQLLTAASVLALMASVPAHAETKIQSKQSVESSVKTERTSNQNSMPSYTTEDVKEGWENTKETVSETASDVTEATKDAYENTVEATKEALEETDEVLEETAETVDDKASN